MHINKPLSLTLSLSLFLFFSSLPHPHVLLPSPPLPSRCIVFQAVAWQRGAWSNSSDLRIPLTRLSQFSPPVLLHGNRREGFPPCVASPSSPSTLQPLHRSQSISVAASTRRAHQRRHVLEYSVNARRRSRNFKRGGE